MHPNSWRYSFIIQRIVPDSSSAGVFAWETLDFAGLFPQQWNLLFLLNVAMSTSILLFLQSMIRLYSTDRVILF